jgi:hypothetical protein
VAQCLSASWLGHGWRGGLDGGEEEGIGFFVVG